MDTNELIRQAEQQLATGDRSARKTLDRARQALLRQRDTQGLEHLLELADRLDNRGDLTYMIQQNLALLSRQGALDSNRASARPSGFGINPASLAALATAVVIYSDVFHFSWNQVGLVAVPGSALGALGVVWAVMGHKRKWFAWTAFGLNCVPSLVAFVLLIAYVVGVRPEPGQGWL